MVDLGGCGFIGCLKHNSVFLLYLLLVDCDDTSSVHKVIFIILYFLDCILTVHMVIDNNCVIRKSKNVLT